MARSGRGEAHHSGKTSLRVIGPGSGAVVMGTGIVSVALALDHHEASAWALLGIAAGL
jgi:hypothetical protein